MRAQGLRSPLVAMSASVLSQEREECLRAGMNDFLPKPFGRSDVQALLARHLGGRWNAEPPAGAAQGSRVFDRARALEACQGSLEVLHRLSQVFLERLAAQLPALRLAAGAGDAETLRREAHAVKGAALNLHAAELAELASAMEAEAMAGRTDQAARQAAELEEAAGRFRQAVSQG